MNEEINTPYGVGEIIKKKHGGYAVVQLEYGQLVMKLPDTIDSVLESFENNTMGSREHPQQ